MCRHSWGCCCQSSGVHPTPGGAAGLCRLRPASSRGPWLPSCAPEKSSQKAAAPEGHRTDTVKGTPESSHAPKGNLRPHRLSHLNDLHYWVERDPGADPSLRKPPSPAPARGQDSTWSQTHRRDLSPSPEQRMVRPQRGHPLLSGPPRPWPGRSSLTTVAPECSRRASCCYFSFLPCKGKRHRCPLLPAASPSRLLRGPCSCLLSGCERASAVCTPTLGLQPLSRAGVYTDTFTGLWRSPPPSARVTAHDNSECVHASLIKWKIDLLTHIL